MRVSHETAGDSLIPPFRNISAFAFALQPQVQHAFDAEMLPASSSNAVHVLAKSRRIPIPIDGCCKSSWLLQGLNQAQLLKHGFLHFLGLFCLYAIKHGARQHGLLPCPWGAQQQCIPAHQRTCLRLCFKHASAHAQKSGVIVGLLLLC